MTEHQQPSACQNLDEAYRYCQNIAHQHYENFPTASKLIRKDLRPGLAAIYAFARQADDIADEGNDASEVRLKKLDAWAVLLDRCTSQKLDQPVFLALGDAINRHHLPLDACHDLLTAFRMDCTIQRYTHEKELLFYCKHSANPVGRLVLALHGIHDTEALHASDGICTALQLTNFWQDLSVDLPRGRCYVPSSWLDAQQLSVEDLLAGQISAVDFDSVKQRLIAYTRDFYQQGIPLIGQLPARLRIQIAATFHGGVSVLNAVQSEPDPLHHRPELQQHDWIKLVPSVLATTSMPGRLYKHFTAKSVCSEEVLP
ncbi:MAG: squalene synthase HpnC [Zetaproteobacteria bacterium CG_4_9_14_3_um_filter_49_83]|nr:MAG: squalene synthase HpnC [Zetaproteobacteria bacterium CG1_02_49_23]PIQ33116.1 MAG: squalene synthase HpnC [Zetaproteobacteria bacterium CG17_big_fil_post_rev_8_21_14_2_50_50_13]PIV29158.1 MAG: squalene synthase HpnC [Zetaproteobacteria bacterium CG02_land_8_20_14_3_00_50_9]PIY55623.1 MAG: squalene synthase HpnC [Zetaproteobacteria bacterium CG_4_10_14_0_8_um_filter_49_80]PJA36431.1 MAG: squalene synthase HpnC [Zetaproteobacteria bacterium CG_4_9_14_3_um_filter_49_83]